VKRPLRPAGATAATYPVLRAAWRILVAAAVPQLALADATLPEPGAKAPAAKGRKRPQAKKPVPAPAPPPKREPPHLDGVMGRRVRPPSGGRLS
jgi:hypothetical protein